MKRRVQALEVTGRVDSKGELHLDEPPTELVQGPVRVILLSASDGEAGEMEWLQAAARNPAFDFLNEPAEHRHRIVMRTRGVEVFSVRADRHRSGAEKAVDASSGVLLYLQEGKDWIGSTYHGYL